MYPILLSIGRLNVYTHGLLMAIGAVVGGLIIFYLAKKEKYNEKIVFDLIVYSLIGGIIGARILYLILYHNQFNSFKEMLLLWNGGLVSFGGIAGGLLTAWIYLKSKKENLPKWFDLGVFGLLIGWAIGRIGCFLNGDSLGLASSSRIAIWGHLPTQIFESLGCLIVAFICLYIFYKRGKLKLFDGEFFLFGIAGYALIRFVVDFWREEINIFWILKSSQILCLLGLIIIAYLLRIKYKNKEVRNGNI